MRAVTYADDTDLNNAVTDEIEFVLVQRRKRAEDLLADPNARLDAEQTRFQQRLVERLNAEIARLAEAVAS